MSKQSQTLNSMPATVLSALLLFLPTAARAADLVADNLTVNDAKAEGLIGEQADGTLGVVHGNPDSGTMGALAELNEFRRQSYRQAAARSGTTEQQEAEKAGKIAIMQTPAGQYYRAANGVWMKK
jgi:uncharacterized protein YdbL (DUF1318 family)